MKMNHMMAQEIAPLSLETAVWCESASLPDSLRKIVESGWSVDSQGAHTLSALRRRSHPPDSFFPNLTFYEAAVNHVHIPGDDPAEQEGGAEKHQLIVRAIAFAYQILRNARNTSNDMIAVIAAGQDKDGASVRAYCKRPGEFWIDEDLEKYTEEAVMTLDFSDIV